MTREEAINILYGMRADNLNLNDLYTKDKYDALGMAIKALEQEPCEDAISRQAAIDAIWDGINMDIYTREVKECLEALPSVTPQQRWIPVSERLPENRNQEVLISLKWGIDIGRYSDGEWHSEWINHYDDGNVLAWMPLPEPYKPQESEDDEE